MLPASYVVWGFFKCPYLPPTRPHLPFVMSPGVPLSHHQRSPSPFLLDSFPLTPHTCPSSHSQLFPIILVPLTPATLSGFIVYVCVICIMWSEYVRFILSGHQHCVAVCGVPFCFFLQLDPELCFTVISLTAPWHPYPKLTIKTIQIYYW